MVFCGKPSKACSNCRTRRIKCDQIEPACSQCLRAGKGCPGYRDQLSLLFRDENEKVLRKAQLPKQLFEQKGRSRGQAKKKGDVAAQTKTNDDVAALNSTVSDEFADWYSTLSPFSDLSLAQSPPSPVGKEDEGLRFFFKHYVTGIEATFMKGDMLSPLWPLVFTNKSLANAVSSVGYAGLSNVTGISKHAVIARKKYVACIHDVNVALKDTSNSDLDATFTAVMLLAAFEVVNGSAPSASAGSWGIHIEGGVAILKMIAARGPHGLPPARMQVQFIFSLIIKCLSKGEIVPESMNEWAQKTTRSMTPHDGHAGELVAILCRFINLYAEIRKTPTLYDSYAIVEESLALDHELEEWDKQLSDRWRFEVLDTTEKMPYIFNGQVHEYKDLWSARIYTNYRWARLLINELVIVHLGKLGSFSSDAAVQKQQSIEFVSKMSAEICTSVSSQFKRYTVLQAIRHRVPPVTGCLFLLFPLAVAGSSISASDELHNWTIQMLEFLCKELGIAQALAMVPITKAHRQSWIDGKDGIIGYNVLTGPLPDYL